MKKLLMTSLMAFILTGCFETTYGPNNNNGGYESYQKTADTFYIKAEGNSVTGPARVHDIARRRAAELCQNNGFTKFQFKKWNRESNTTVNAVVADTKTNASYREKKYDDFDFFNQQSKKQVSAQEKTRISEEKSTTHSVEYEVLCVKNNNFGENVNEVLSSTTYLLKN